MGINEINTDPTWYFTASGRKRGSGCQPTAWLIDKAKKKAGEATRLYVEHAAVYR